MNNNHLKLAIVIGTRAQLIKMAPILQFLQNYNIKYWFLYTGQHKDTIDNILNDFDIKKPDNIATNLQEHKTVTSLGLWFLSFLKNILFCRRKLLPVKQGLVLVHGDTISTLLGSILAISTKNRVMHIEAGLRSKSILNPFPEELTRRIVSKLSTYHACPGINPYQNIKCDLQYKINTSNNTLLDSLKYALSQKIKFDIPNFSYAIASIHRTETIYNFQKLKKALNIFRIISEKRFLYIVGHPSLVTRLERCNLYKYLDDKSMKIIPRMSYVPFIKLLARAELLLTDGGSNQEESYYLGVPTLILREYTERQEGLSDNAIIVGFSETKVRTYNDRPDLLLKQYFLKKESPTAMIVDWIVTNII
jgi:UDP-N-acetylglucosamine 2-epimerase (non-hydrolysing)